MKLSALLFLLLFSPLLLLAQANYKRGYVVTHTGDTLQGFINLKEWNRNPKVLNFKTAAESETTHDYSTTTCSYFEVDGMGAFQRHTVSVSLDKVVLPDISVGIDTSKVTETVFLKVLQKGKHVTLFSYRDNIKTRLYLLDNDKQTPEELIYKVYYEIKEHKAQNFKEYYTAKSKLYVGQLWIAANKYDKATPALKAKLDLTTYSEADILKIVDRINETEKQKTSLFRSSNGDSRIRLFGGVGLNKTTIELTGENVLTVQTLWDEANATEVRSFRDRKDASFGPKLNVGLDYFLHPTTKQFYLRTELGLASVNYHISNLYNYRYTKRELVYDYNSRLLIASIAPQLVYNVYNKENTKLNLGIGAAYNKGIYLQNRMYIIPQEGTNEAARIVDEYMPWEDVWINIPVRAGAVLYKNLELSVIYWTPVRFATGKALYAKARSLDVGINFLINRSNTRH